MRTSSRWEESWRSSQKGTVLYPGHEDIPELPPGSKDTEIFEEIGAGRRDLLFVTRDKRIRTRPIERAKLRDAGVRAVFLTGSSNMTQDDIYRLIIEFWDDLAALDSRSGPRSFALTPIIHGWGLKG